MQAAPRWVLVLPSYLGCSVSWPPLLPALGGCLGRCEQSMTPEGPQCAGAMQEARGAGSGCACPAVAALERRVGLGDCLGSFST